MSEANESPAATARREVKEELDLDLQPVRPLCIDWVSPHRPWDDSLMFIFDGGTLTSAQINGLKLLDGELRIFEFCTAEEAADRLRPTYGSGRRTHSRRRRPEKRDISKTASCAAT